MPGHGDRSARVLILGESPGAKEEQSGLTFQGDAGDVLNELLGKVGIDRKEDCYIVNVVGCRPSTSEGLSANFVHFVDCCRQNALEKVRGCKPTVIIALGNAALYLTTGKVGGIQKERGIQPSWEVFPDVPLVAVVHPAAILRNPAAFPGALEDLQKAAVFLDARKLHEVEYQLVGPGEDLTLLKQEFDRDGIFSFDVETTGLNWLKDKTLCVGFSTKPYTAYVLPLLGQHCQELWSSNDYGQALTWLQEVFAEEYIKSGVNLKFDLRFLRMLGVYAQSFLFDVGLAHHLIAEDDPHSLEYIATKYTDMLPYKQEFHSHLPNRKTSFDTVDAQILWEYLAKDADATIRATEAMFEKLDEEGLLGFYENFTEPLIKEMLEMELKGVLIDVEKLEAQKRTMGMENFKLLNSIRKRAGNLELNIRSPKQVGELLFDKLGLEPVKKTSSGNRSVDMEVLSALAKVNPLAKDILDYRTKEKLISFLGDESTGLVQFLDEGNRVHPIAQIGGTVTGRVVYRDPTLQNIPDREAFRGLIIAPEGFSIVAVDYSQAELWVAAYYSGDDVLIQALGTDVHNEVARFMYGLEEGAEVSGYQRTMAKRVVFGLNYGISEYGLAGQLESSLDEARLYIDKYFRRFCILKGFIDKSKQDILLTHRVTNCYGRTRHLTVPDQRVGMSQKEARRLGEVLRQGVNFRFQSSASDTLHFALLRVLIEFAKAGLEAKVLFTHHDAMICEIRNDHIEAAVEILNTEMRRPIKELKDLVLKNSIEIGPCWKGKADH